MSHVFVLKANILHLNADAWMLPTDADCDVQPQWTKHDPSLSQRVEEAALTAFGEEGRLAFAVPTEGRVQLPVATAVPWDNFWSKEVTDVRVQAFVKAATAALGTRASSRPYLLAMPFLGSGGGRASDLGSQVADLLEAARGAAEEHEVDIALVFHGNDAAYTLAQSYRREAWNDWWEAFDFDIQSEVQRLGELARNKRLVPFLGAGVSVSAGAPTWNQLLSDLAERLDLDNVARANLSKLNPLDRASLIEILFAEQQSSPDFRKAVAGAVNIQRYGLAPALLASIGSEGAITLNYDRLFEMACEDAGAERFVIADDDRGGERWLLKLHGDVKNPDSIVLTRDDYLGYDANRDALSALVKAHLITHHLLFVGFGLGDDHFYEIIHDVRRAVPASLDGSYLGTALSLYSDPLQERAWRGKLRVLPMTGQDFGQDDAGAGRRLEIFLDAVMAYATQEHRYLLAEKFGDGLPANDRSLREDLLELASRHDAISVGSIWPVVRAALEEFGLTGQKASYESDHEKFDLVVQSQPVTEKDRRRSNLRVPTDSKHAFPESAAFVRIVVDGSVRDVWWHPRVRRSGTLGLGVDVMRRIGRTDERVEIGVRNGTYYLLG